MSILAIDTALNGCAVGVFHVGKQACFSSQEFMQRGQAERLVPAIQETLEEAGLCFDELDVLLTTLGPGTFTGLRIGLSAAKGFALALDIPLIGITTLQALALQYLQDRDSPVAVILESKRADFYFQCFDKDARPSGDAQALMGADLASQLCDHVLIGDGVQRFLAEGYSFEDAGLRQIDPGFLARFYSENQDHFVFTSHILPIYLRGADVSMSKKKNRVIG